MGNHSIIFDDGKSFNKFSFVTIHQLPSSLLLCLLFGLFSTQIMCKFCSTDKDKQSMFVHSKGAEGYETCYYTAVRALSVLPLNADFSRASGQWQVVALRVLCAVTWKPRWDRSGWSVHSCRSYRSNLVVLLCMGSIRFSAEMLMQTMKDLGLWNIFGCIVQVREPPSWVRADEKRCRKPRKVKCYSSSNK